MATQEQHTQLITLLQRVIELAQQIAVPVQRTAAKPGNNAKTQTPGIYPHQSKYNPWRAYIWDTQMRKSVYLGAFPSKAKALAAQKAYKTGSLIRNGTKANIQLVRGAA